jgi:integrase
VANFRSYKTDDGKKRILAVVRIKGFNPVRKAFGSKRDAGDWADATEKELREQRDRGGARPDLGTLTLRQLIEAFLADPKVKQRRYHSELKVMLALWCVEFGADRVRGFGRLQIVAFRDGRLASGLTPARANRYLSAMRRAWNWGIENGYVTGVWPQKIMLEEPKPEALLEKYGIANTTVENVDAVFAACDGVLKPLGDLVRFLVGTGARLSDALGVRWRDVDLENKDVMIRGQKTSKPQRVAMLAPAVSALNRLGKVRHVKGAVFWQIENRFAASYLFGRARASFPEHLRKMRLHDCRHLCASFLASQGASHVELAAQLGHSTLLMVKRYSHLGAGHRGAAHDRFDAAFDSRDKKPAKR